MKSQFTPFENTLKFWFDVVNFSIGRKSGNYFKDRFSQMIQISEKLYFLVRVYIDMQ